MSHQKNGFEKGHSDAYLKNLKRWEKDYQLQELDRLHLFDEYIEMSNLFYKAYDLTELSCKSGIYQERGPKGSDFKRGPFNYPWA